MKEVCSALIGFIITVVVKLLPFEKGSGPALFCCVKAPRLLVCVTNVTVEFPAEFVEVVINGLHEFRFMLFCFLIPALPAARIAAWLPDTVICEKLREPTVLPSLEGGRPSVPKVYVEVSDVGEKMKEAVEADGEGVL